MERIRYLTVFITTMFFVMLTGCVDNNVDIKEHEPGVTPVEDIDTRPENGNFIYGNATVEKINLVILESFPVQVHVIASGYLPDGCTEINNIITSREGNTLLITITTKRPADALCTQVIRPFEKTIPLDAVGLKAGIYKVVVNGVSNSFELTVDNILPK